MGVINHPIVGRVPYGVGSGGRLILPDGWESQNIGVAVIPQLKGVPTYNGRFSGNVRFYKPAIPQLVAAFAAIEAAGLKDRLIFWDGSFVPRVMRGTASTPSNHSFGTALDMNADWNGFHQTPAANGAKGDLHPVADVIKRFGFDWGGDWRRPDGMHFEVSKILGELPQTENEMVYTLFFGTDKADELPTFDGVAFVAAWKWAEWFHLKLGWNPATGHVTFDDRELHADIRMIGDRAFIPIRAAVAFLGLRLTLDDGKREIVVTK